MEIVVAETKELYEQCLDIRKRVFVEEQNVPLDREIDEHEDFATHILLRDDTPLGTVRYRPLSKETVKVERMAVMPEARGLKLGRKLMDFVHEHAKHYGYEKARLGAQTHATSFYEKLGYKIVSDEFEDAGIPHVYMEREI